MALTASSVRGAARAAPSSASASRLRAAPPRRAVTTRAFLDQFKDLMRVFTPGANDVPAKGTAAFTGNTRPHGAGRAFSSDNFVASRKQQKKAQATPTTSVAAQLADMDRDAEESGFGAYLGGAVQRLMGHNFKGDSTEQGKPPAGTGASGWKGKIRHRETDGVRRTSKF